MARCAPTCPARTSSTSSASATTSRSTSSAPPAWNPSRPDPSLLFDYYRLYNLMINPLQKYQKLLEALAPDAQPAHSHHNAYFFFRNLRILDAELLLGEIEVALG